LQDDHLDILEVGPIAAEIARSKLERAPGQVVVLHSGQCARPAGFLGFGRTRHREPLFPWPAGSLAPLTVHKQLPEVEPPGAGFGNLG
jgi:hypothetical protein